MLGDVAPPIPVGGWTGSLGTVTARVVHAAVAYDCPKTFETFILIFHQALYSEDMETHLLNPFQMRERGIVVDDKPLQHTAPEDRTKISHSIVDPESGLQIPLTLEGTMSGFTVRKPTWAEIWDETKTQVEMTSEATWNPGKGQPETQEFERMEAALRAELENDLILPSPRDRGIGLMQARGQDGAKDVAVEAVAEDTNAACKVKGSGPAVESACPDTLERKATVKSVNELEPNWDKMEAMEDAFADNDGAYLYSRETPRSLKSMQHLDSYSGVRDIDQYADSLLLELGVTEAGAQDLGSKLAAATTQRRRPGFVNAEKLAKNWRIGLELARRTVEATTQVAVRDFSSTTGSRRLKPRHWLLDQKRVGCAAYHDTYFGKCKSLRGNTCAAVFGTTFHSALVDALRTKGDSHYSFDVFCERIGIPTRLISDNAPELIKGDFGKKARRAQCPIKPIETETENANIAETVIRELLRHYKKVMHETNCPEVLWDYCLEWCAQVRSHLALNIRHLDGMVPETKLTGDTADISHLAEFGFYDWVWYIENTTQPGMEDTAEPSKQRKRLGKYLGPANSVGSAMCGTILTEKATFRHKTSIFPLTTEDKYDEGVIAQKKEFKDRLRIKLKDRVKGMKKGEDPADLEMKELEAEMKEWSKIEHPEFPPYEQWDPAELGFDIPDDGKRKLPELEEADDFDVDGMDYNGYIASKVILPRDGHTFATGTVKARVKDSAGELVGKSNANPLLDTAEYLVEFEDGTIDRYHANIIAENIHSRIDSDGNTHYVLEDIIDHMRDGTALRQGEGFTYGAMGKQVPKQTTRGWKLCIRLKDQSTQWVKLKDLKESNPVELAEYAVANQLVEEPAFKWWVPFTIRKRNRILKAMKTRYHRTQQKFGIELPKTVKRALEIDKETGTTYWRDAIRKEMRTVGVAFNILEEGAEEPKLGRRFMSCHVVFDIKAFSLVRKARLVANPHYKTSDEPMQDVPTYAGVVSRESVRIAFTLAALNGLDIVSADCGGAYLNAKPRETLYTKCGPEFGEMEGRWAIIVRALYGAASSASSWRKCVSDVIESLGFKMCRADNDVWMRPATKADGLQVYEYVLVYSDDLIMIGIKPEEIAAQISQIYKFKNDKWEEPAQYLGANVGKMRMPNDLDCWFMGSEEYCKTAIQNIEAWLQKREQRLPTKTACAFPSKWKPELDVTPELVDEDANYYQQQIGVLRWLVELGRIDIITEVSMLVAHSACPRQGHLAAVVHLFAYLKGNPRSKTVFDPTPIQHAVEKEHDWSDFYPDYEEVKPPDMPEPRGNPLQMTCWVDSDHCGDVVSRRSRTGVIIFCGSAPIVWHSKKQGSVETSSFGSELTAMKTAVELVEGLRYKLRMMGVPLDGFCHLKADNMSVVHNCSNPASQLKKKSNSICYHFVRERCSGKSPVCRVSYCPTDANLADVATKSSAAPVKKRLAMRMLF